MQLFASVVALTALAGMACAQFLPMGNRFFMGDLPDNVMAPLPMLSAPSPFRPLSRNAGAASMFYMGDMPDYYGDYMFFNRGAGAIMGKKKRKKRFVPMFPPFMNPFMGPAAAAGAFARARTHSALATGAAMGAAAARNAAAASSVGGMLRTPQNAQPMSPRPTQAAPMQSMQPMQPMQQIQSMAPMPTMTSVMPSTQSVSLQPLTVLQPMDLTNNFGSLGNYGTVGVLDNLFGAGGASSGFSLMPDSMGLQSSNGMGLQSSNGMVNLDSLMSPGTFTTTSTIGGSPGFAMDLGLAAAPSMDPWMSTVPANGAFDLGLGSMPLAFGTDLVDVQYII